MNSRTIDVVTDWETVSAPEGYEGLHHLADAEFSGAVSTGMTWAFFLNGRVIGTFEGGIESFEGADLTAYRAADPSLPLLFAMQERGGETRAKYYTNDTPLREADQTLSGGGFTGYVELSENVLSGNYYVVYHGGKSMSAAFVGSSDRLITGDEAFETAADEVGIYEVIDVEVDIVEIPELADPSAEGDTADETADGGDGSVAGSPDSEPPGETSGREATAADEPSRPNTAASPADRTAAGERTSDERTADDLTSADETRTTADGTETETPRETASTADETGPEADDETATSAGDSAQAADETAASAGSSTSSGGRTHDRPAEAPAAESATADDESDAADDDVFSDEERWREARTIPSLDPDESSQNGTAEGVDGRESRSARERVAQMQKQRAARRDARQRSGRSSERSEDAETDRTRDRPEGRENARTDADRLEDRLSRARKRIDELESERDEMRAEREELRSERAEYRERVEELEAERDELEARVERLEAELRSAETTSYSAESRESMSPDRALSGTNLFVRYDQKGGGTLEDAHAGEASREDVRENLRLEHHTTFETDEVAVEGRPYEEYLRNSTEYAFAKWVVTRLLYEIGETGNRTGMAGVFDAIPDVDRVELYGTVGADTEDGVERRDFDVIFRDKMGDPLFVADINASRNATTEAMVESLVENTGTIAEGTESLAAGFYVTESFYEPGALETVSEETGGGLFARSKKLSYVKLSRKRGYHLCLAEARDGEFHLNVPDL